MAAACKIVAGGKAFVKAPVVSSAAPSASKAVGLEGFLGKAAGLAGSGSAISKVAGLAGSGSAISKAAGLAGSGSAISKVYTRTYSTHTGASPNQAKLLFEVHCRVVPSMAAPSPSAVYQMSMSAGTEEEAVGLFRSFVSSLKTNNIEELAALRTTGVCFTELKESVGAAAVEVRQQLTEQKTDVLAEISSLKRTCLAGEERVKGAMALHQCYVNEDLTQIKITSEATFRTVREIYKDSKRVTLLKVIAYGSVASLANMVWNWGLGELVEKQTSLAKKYPLPPDDQSGIPPHSVPLFN